MIEAHGDAPPPAPEPPSESWAILKAENEKLAESWKSVAIREAQVEARAQRLQKIAAIYEPAEKILATRVKLMLALIGAFVLALYAMSWQTPAALWVMIAWCALAIMPLVCLEWSARRARPPGA